MTFEEWWDSTNIRFHDERTNVGTAIEFAKAAWEAATKAAREACAKVCEEQPSGFTCSEYDRACAENAAAIRAINSQTGDAP